MLMTDYHAPCVRDQLGADYYIGQIFWKEFKNELTLSAIILTSIAICILFSF
jgi:hypothetical protein